MSETLTVLVLSGEDDVFAARQVARVCAEELGLDRLDAIRVATAVSELGREVVTRDGGHLTVRLGRGELLLDLDTHSARDLCGVAGPVGRLVDELVTGDGRITLLKRLPRPVPLTPSIVSSLRHRIRAHAPSTPTDELREQNHELITALDEVRRQKAELEVVNNELEETNRGVMALYHELSAELDRTNQGVVALYAEIEDKNEQLREASEAKSRFLRSISHELRTPANSVLGLTRLLTDPSGAPLSAEQLEQIEFIRASASDLLRLVNELLDLSRAEAGALRPDPAPVDLVALFEELRGPTESLLRPGVRLVIGDALTVTTDGDMLRHVLRNLLSNAAKFTAQGTVEVAASRQGELVAVSVHDSGVGIEDADLARIFEEFYQVRTPLHTSAKGTGLGLPFAQRVARALGGSIEVESTPGVGSTFTLLLPVQPPAAAAIA
ncbi:sensor histidine kinase [Nocardioides sp. CER19]|uniref:ATP-binding protein n=1 Tax=Nocardioides sp. CER19 TaxID=3038538 RepID=UPI00244B1251|nr:sensor histidine kinase [Nocardioides sp. CER19]MDH2414724.1 sensor histidine kinase [Nocardioides sp. CER19]